jgi:multidrug efflux pump
MIQIGRREYRSLQSLCRTRRCPLLSPAERQSFQKLLLVISVAPLGLIGVVAALLPTGTPMGFVAILGIIALSGMIIRNSVILIDQSDMDLAKGLHPWDAVTDATTHRTRPILLTAAAASLGMIPIAPEVFWGRWPTRSWAACSSRP